MNIKENVYQSYPSTCQAKNQRTVDVQTRKQYPEFKMKINFSGKYKAEYNQALINNISNVG